MFVVWSDDWKKLRKISTFLNSGNKIKAFDASWAANIVTTRDFWVALDNPPKEWENAKTHSLKWKVRIRTCVRIRGCYLIFYYSFLERMFVSL